MKVVGCVDIGRRKRSRKKQKRRWEVRDTSYIVVQATGSTGAESKRAKERPGKQAGSQAGDRGRKPECDGLLHEAKDAVKDSQFGSEKRCQIWWA